MKDGSGKMRFSAHIGYLFTELPFRARFAAARDAGFDAVEFPAPYLQAPAAEVAALLAGCGLPYVQFGLPSGDPAKGEKGIGIFPDRREEFRAGLDAALDYAEAIGVRMIHAMAGVLPEADRRPHHAECYAENLAHAAARAAPRGIRIIVEAMSPVAVPDYVLATPEAAAAAIADAGGANLGLLLDLYHTQAIGADPVAALRRHADLVAHVHIADHPGRHEPGSAEMDFAAIAAALAEIGYTGVVGCEYAPATDTVAGLGWLRAGLG